MPKAGPNPQPPAYCLIQVTGLISSFDLVEEGNGAAVGTARASLPEALAHSVPLPPARDCSFQNPVQCLFMAPYCVPQVRRLELDSTSQTLTFTFNVATTTPAFPTLAHLLSVLELGPEVDTSRLLAGNGVGVKGAGSVNATGFSARWREPEVLEARLPAGPFNAIYQAGAAGVLEYKLRTSDCRTSIVEGNFTFRYGFRLACMKVPTLVICSALDTQSPVVQARPLVARLIS